MHLLIVVIIHVATSLPVEIPELRPEAENGKIFHVSSVEELRQLGNGTVPEALLADVTPPEYYSQQAYVPKSDMLSHLIAPSAKKGKRAARSVAPACPVTWVVSFDGYRWPPRINKAVCNGQGTTCLSAHGHPSCKEYLVEFQVYRFLGITSSGAHVWRSEKEAVPVLCTCDGY